MKAQLTKKAQKILADQNKSRAVSSGDLGAIECADCGHPMDDHDGDEGDCGVDGCDCDGYTTAARANSSVELRFLTAPILNVEVRDTEGNGDGTWTMSGYAAVFDRTTTLYDGRFMKLTEDIHPAAFDEVLRSQGIRSPEGVVHFNFGHDMNRAVAATDVPPGQPGWLDLRADSRGLFYLAKVSKDDPDGIAMAVKMRDGVLRQASFAFTIAGAEDSDSESPDGRMVSHRRITRVGRLFDVCATAQGAYPQTVSQLRTYAAAIGQLEQQLEGRLVSRDFRGENAVSPDLGGGVARTRLLARAQRERMRFQKAS